MVTKKCALLNLLSFSSLLTLVRRGTLIQQPDARLATHLPPPTLGLGGVPVLQYGQPARPPATTPPPAVGP
jgi:hypothetical protein